ncbi:Dynein heavy chain 3, axonemal-like 4 [Homarus americanus]|uniref:Dynein heavy chain 3, axonemal-like 4 n=1 Tax=Homarus americanus TaxID=6706 RepID=A0A8J5K5B6_HOMAM|nr:Dynein heavy chain 3, axonemal-like 4 [Homarus americanus]
MLCQVMEAVCVMLDLKPERKPDPNGSGKMIEDYWAPSQKLLGDMKFLQNLLHYDKENIPTKIITHVRNEFYSHPDFDPKKIRMVSMACEGLCRWVRAMVVYDQVIKIVAPKKHALEAANHELAPQNERLEEKRKELREFFQRWADEKIPDVFWFSGLFFPYSFLTGIRQNYARKHAIPIDRIDFLFKVMEKEVEDIIQECIRPNFVELPVVIERLPTPNVQGQYYPLDTDLEDNESLPYDNDSPQLKKEGDQTVKVPTEQQEKEDNENDSQSQSHESDDVIYQVIPRQAQGGTYTWGFFLEGARWDREQHCLAEMSAKQLHDQLPIILFQPAALPDMSHHEGVSCKYEDQAEEKGMYHCPVYRTSERSGTLSTTGHSSNYILDLILPSSLPCHHWVSRAAAALTQLDD